MIELHELHYTRAELATAPAPDRTFFLMATGLANDLQTLMKLFAVAVGEQSKDQVIVQGSSAVAMLTLRLLAGRLWEGFKLLQGGFGPIEPLYINQLSPDSQQALSQLRSYFADRRNLIATVRDKIGFHAEEKTVRRAFVSMPDDTAMGDYLSRTMANTLYYSAELIHYEAISRFTGGGDQAASLRTLVGDVQAVVRDFNTFIYGFAATFLRSHLRRQLDEMRDRRTKLDGLPAFDDLKLPYFSELPDAPVPDPSAEKDPDSGVGSG